MNKLQRLNEMQAQIDALKAEVEREQNLKQWEPKGGKFWIDDLARIHNLTSVEQSRLAGSERDSLKVAEKAAKEIISFKQLLAYRDEFSPDYKFEFNKSNYFIVQKVCGTYIIGEDELYCEISKIYMPKGIAIELCRKLESGEVVL